MKQFKNIPAELDPESHDLRHTDRETRGFHHTGVGAGLLLAAFAGYLSLLYVLQA